MAERGNMPEDKQTAFDRLMEGVPSIHREGHRFILAFAVATLILFLIWVPLGWLGTGLTAWCVYFFRDPDRVTPVRPGLIVAPADGVVQAIDNASPPPELNMDDKARTRISIFMNVFNVHVNRVPTDGEIIGLAYRPGKFLNATLDKASEDNERQAVHLRTAVGDCDLAVVQIAGLIARRIVCELELGQTVAAGERFGMIRFGSRVDVYLDAGLVPLVVVGQTTVAGETILADIKSHESARMGKVR